MKVGSLVVYVNQKLRKINLGEVIYAEANRRTVNLYLKNDEKIALKMRLDELLQQLPSQHFLRINETFVVAVELIDAVVDQRVIIHNQQISLHKLYAQEVVQAFRAKVERQFLALKKAAETEKPITKNAV